MRWDGSRSAVRRKRRLLTGRGGGCGTHCRPPTSVVKKQQARQTRAGASKNSDTTAPKCFKEKEEGKDSPPPRSAAVIITPPVEGSISRADVMLETRSKVRLEDLGISHVRPKIAATGAIILKVPEKNSAARADLLAVTDKLQVALAEKNVRVSKPVKCADLRITGLDESVNKEEFMSFLTVAGGCYPTDIKAGEIRRGPTGLGAWAQCPQARCTAPVGRGDQCYRCGQSGHVAGGCSAKPECSLCRNLGRPARHRLRSAACAPLRKKRDVAGTMATPAISGGEATGTQAPTPACEYNADADADADAC